MSAIEGQIDELYQAPLEEFTARRNALAKILSGADAQHVKKLSKPTVVPWVANQLYWKARATYDRLLKSGERLRRAQLGALEGRAADVRAATETHRQALSDAVREAERVASTSGVHPAPDALMRTFEALSLMRDAPAPPGRLTETLQPAGFEALAGLPVRPVDVRPKPPATRDSVSGSVFARSVRLEPDIHTPDPRHAAAARARELAARKRAEAAAKIHEASVKKAEVVLARAKTAAAVAREVLDRAERAVAAAEADVQRLRAHRAP